MSQGDLSLEGPTAVKDVLEAAPDAILVVDLKGRIVFANRLTERMFGFAKEELGEKSVDLLVSEKSWHILKQLSEPRPPSNRQAMVLSGRRKNGVEFPVEVSFSPLETDEGQLLIGILRDTSQRLQAEANFRGLLESAPDAMVVVDGSGRVLIVNSQTERLFGYSRDELLGKPIEVLVPDRYREKHIDHRSGYSDNPKTRPMGSAAMSLTGRRRDGSEFPVEISLSPMQTEEGVLVTAAVRDITERLKIEAKFRNFLEAAPDAIVIVNGDGQIVILNTQAEKLFGFKREELIGQLVDVLVPSRFRGRHEQHRLHFSDDPKVRPMGSGLELFGLRKDGVEFPVEISLSPIETEEGALFSAAIRDISERKAVENRIRTSLKEKEVLLKEIHHRVKNNLQIVSSMLNLQIDQITDAATLSLFRESQSRVRSIALFHEKLYQSKDLAHVEIGDYLKGLALGLFAAYGVSPDDVLLSITAEAVTLGVDAAISCGLIVNELLSNSLKHAFPGKRKGTVRIALRLDGPQVLLEVGDDGIGFPPGIDFRNPSSLGMKLVCIMTEQIGGAISLDRSAGTLFVMRFPHGGHE